MGKTCGSLPLKRRARTATPSGLGIAHGTMPDDHEQYRAVQLFQAPPEVWTSNPCPCHPHFTRFANQPFDRLNPAAQTAISDLGCHHPQPHSVANEPSPASG